MFINTESRGALAIVQGGLCQIDKKILNIDYHPASLMAIVQTDQSCSFITNKHSCFEWVCGVVIFVYFFKLKFHLYLVPNY